MLNGGPNPLRVIRVPSAASQVAAVAQRVLRQLARDRRFLALSLIAPLAIIYLLKVFFDTVESPLFDATPFAVPIGAFVVHFITYVLCAIVLVRERTAQTLQRMFVNGYRQSEIISGYLVAYSTLATVQSLLVLIELRLLFHLTHGLSTLLSIYFVIWLLAVISIALGIFVSNFARNEGQVFPFIPLVILPSVFLSGIIISVERLPGWARWLSRGIPLYYANRVLQDLIRPSATLSWAGVGLLVVYGVALLTLATLTLRESD
jgi:ABC-2 type transport system permease protein